MTPTRVDPQAIQFKL
jgi:hypothetical protein